MTSGVPARLEHSRRAVATASEHIRDSAQLPICGTCAMQYAAARDDCPICEDERQFVPLSGRWWTSLERLRTGEYTGVVAEQGPGITGIGTRPVFGIGQRALLVPTASGPVLWDCIAYLDDALIRRIHDLGGITAIAVSHPHFYTTMVDWAEAFDVDVHVHEKDAAWIGRPHPRVRLWSGDTLALTDELTLLNLGVHFPGGTVLHLAGDAGHPDGAIFSGDIVNVIPDREHVAFMYSYPNHIPERPEIVRHAAELLAPYSYDVIYGAWWDAVVRSEAEEVVRRSVERYLARVGFPDRP